MVQYKYMTQKKVSEPTRNAAARHKRAPSFAVIMGDIVDSENTRAGGRLSREFNRSIIAANREFHQELESPLTITLGDEFQGLAKDLKKGFRIIEKLRRNLLAVGVDCRFVLGIVQLDSKLNTDNAWNMMGDGLAQARAKLNNKKDTNIYRFSILDDQGHQRLLDAVGLALTILDEGWTVRQRRCVALRSEGLSVEVIAKKQRVSARSVYKVLEAARWFYYEEERQAILFVLAILDVEWNMT